MYRPSVAASFWIGVILLVLVVLTWVRITYPWHTEEALWPLINRASDHRQAFPAIKLLGFISYAIIFSLGTLAVIWLLFRDNILLRITGWILAGLYLLMGLLTGVAFLAGNVDYGYGAAQTLKEVVQSPLLLVILVPTFLFFEGERDAGDNQSEKLP